MAELNRARWAQFSYASVGAGVNSGSGGWQIAQSSPDFMESELAVLRPLAVTQYDEAKLQIPQFPTPEDLEARPRWFRYQSTALGGVYLHAAPAGPDASLRPRNVFNHLLLDRTPEIDDQRPIMLWGSPTFLAPYGAEAVAAAQLTESAQPLLPGRVTRESAISFLVSAAAARPDLLTVLLDAVYAATQGGTPVVLVSDDTNSAAHWIAAVSMLTTPQWARMINWSLFETADRLEEAWRNGVHLAVVPHSELESLPADASVVVLDELVLHQVAAQDGALGRHTTAAGHFVAQTAWSQIALYVLTQHPDSFAMLADLIDELGEQNLTSAAAPEWPLAMAALHSNLPGTGEVVAATIEYRTPIAVLQQPWLMQHVVSVVSENVGDDAAAAFARLNDAQHDPGSLGYGLIYRAYLIAALGDGEFQYLKRQIPLPEIFPPDVGAPQQLFDAAVSAMDQEQRRLALASDPGEAATRAAAILDLSLRIGLLVRASDSTKTLVHWFDAQRTSRELYEAAIRLTQTLAQKSCAEPTRVWLEALAPHLNLRDLLVVALGEVYQLRGAAEIVSSIAVPNPPKLLAEIETRLRQGQLEPAPQSQVNSLLFEVAEFLMDSGQQRNPESPYAAVLLYGGAERGVHLKNILRERDWTRPTELALLAEVEKIRPGWIPTDAMLRLTLRSARSAQLTALMSQRWQSVQKTSGLEAEAIRLRAEAERFLGDTLFSRQSHQILQTFIDVRREAQRLETENESFSELPSAAPIPAQASPADGFSMLGFGQPPQPVVKEYAVNAAVFAPLVVSACVMQEIEKIATSPEARRAFEEFISVTPMDLVENALVRSVYGPNGAIDLRRMHLLLEASLTLELGADARALLEHPHDYSCTSVTFSADSKNSKRARDRRRVVDVALAQLCIADEAAAGYVEQARASVEQRTAEDSKLQSVLKQHFARILPREGMVGKMMKSVKIPFGKGS